MHLVETYALNCGLKIDKPFIYEKYCPIPFEKYISFQPYSKYESKSYDLWQEVINQVVPYLQSQNIHIIQIGGKDEKPFENCYHMQGKTTINQAAYIIKRSLMHVGADSFGIHIASSYDKNIVALYSNSRPENAGPYFNINNQPILLEINKENRKPSYSAVEQPKTINEIDPILVANSILNTLNIGSINIKTINIGNEYSRKLVESVPNAVIADITKLGISSLIMRMDYEHNESVLVEQLKRNNCSIVTKRPIDISILNNFKANIAQVIYDLDQDHDINFAKQLKKLGRPYIFSTFLSEDFVQSIKFKYMDYGQINKSIKSTKNDLKDINNLNLSKLLYKSNKITISNGNVYNSKAAYKANHVYTGNPINIIDNEDFWEESKYFYIFELTDK